MHIIHEDQIEGDKIDVPYKRTIKHLSAQLGSKKLWVGTSSVEPGNTSNPHSHAEQEEVFYCVSGKGRIKVDDEEDDFYPGMICYVPPGAVHQLINTGNEVLKVLASVSPTFEPEQFKKDHEMN